MRAYSISALPLLSGVSGLGWPILAGSAVLLIGLIVLGLRRIRESRRDPRIALPTSTTSASSTSSPVPSGDAALLMFPDDESGRRRGHPLLRLLVLAAGTAAVVAAAPAIHQALRPAPLSWSGAVAARTAVNPAAEPAPGVDASGDAAGAGAFGDRRAVPVAGIDAGSETGSMSQPVVVDPGTGERLILWAGDGQEGEPGTFLREALSVILRDSADRPIADREVRFEVARGGGRVEPSTVRTSRSGLALTRWWPGTDPDSLRVTVHVEGRPELSLRFLARLNPDARSTRVVAAGAGSGNGASSDPVDAGGGAVDRAPTPTPLAVAVARRGRSTLVAGGVHTCVLDGGGFARCWGGLAGEVGSRAGGSSGSAEALRSVRAGVRELCGVTATDRVLCWSARSDGADDAEPVDVRIPGGAPVVDVSVGTQHACALNGRGAVYCWGSNLRGQLGNGTTEDATDPVRVTGVPAVAVLAGGWLHGCALTGRGEAYCWGANGAGQLGDGSTADRATPVRVLQAGPFTTIEAGSSHTCALARDGAAWCWGDNAHGQLGTGAATGGGRPARVDVGIRFVALSAGSVHTCGLAANGRVWCWGRNTFGQLGDGTLRDSPTPAPIASTLRFTAVSAGGAHTCAEAEGGDTYCWGNNIQGQLGDGTRDSRPEPVRVSR